MSKPEDWKNYEDFSAGIDHNRLPSTDELVGESFLITPKSGVAMALTFEAADRLHWSSAADSGEDWYEAIKVGPDVYFIDMTFKSKPREALTAIVNRSTPPMRCQEVLDLMDCGEVLILAAMERKETRERHIRSDYPFTNPLLENRYLTIWKEGGDINTTWRDKH